MNPHTTSARTLLKRTSLRGKIYKVVSDGTITYGDEIVATWEKKAKSKYTVCLGARIHIAGRENKFETYNYLQMIEAIACRMEFINCYQI